MIVSGKTVTASRFSRNGSAALSSVLRSAILRERTVAPHTEIHRQGQTPKSAHVVISGYMYRYCMLADGRRQITALLLPGDICDADAVLSGKACYTVIALTTSRIGEIEIGSRHETDDLSPELRQILWRQILREAAISHERMLSLGRRNALEHMAHLLCELWTRLRAVGLANPDGCELMFTQREFGDILGLSTVHVNRTLQELRARALIQYRTRTLQIFDHPGLAKLASFDPGYLDLAHP